MRWPARATVAAVAILLTASLVPELPSGAPRPLLALAAPPVARAAGPGGPAAILVADDVAAVLRAAAEALDDPTLAVAVVDRAGTILGVYARPQAAERTPDVAVSLARTTAYFSNDQAPLSSRTVRFISGIHFPPGIFDAPNAALYGVENINRGCTLDDTGDAIFNAPIVRPRSLAGTFGASPLPCRPGDTRGCAVGGPIAGLDGQPIWSLGITTGKRDLLDSDNGAESTIDPGGIPLYRGAQLVGGVGVAGVARDRAEFAALVAALGAGRGLTTGIDLPKPLPPPGAIYIEGIRLPFTSAAPDRRPAGSAPGRFSDGAYVVAPRDGRQAPEGYLIGPRGSAVAGGLDEADVRRIVEQAVAQAERSRAQVRLPYGGAAPRFIIAVSDERGEVLAEYRMGDALFDAVDVVPSKARNAYYFSTREGYDVLRGYVQRAGYGWDEPPPGQGWALTSRTISFGGQPLFPPGIDRNAPRTPGPWFELFVYDTLNPCSEGPGPSRGGDPSFVNQNGITWFPGSAPLFKNGRLVGGLGVSGDGVEQNDLVTAGGAQGFEPPLALRVDNSEIRSLDGRKVRLPYLKFPRNPEQP
ncbi:MAG: heme-binding protein [Vicinamibacteria bacterium]|jgi:uncharacterized protein GlcG (DUF336 family)|nr:heme-binding protein [Vicinamibacteria bacterium]